MWLLGTGFKETTLEAYQCLRCLSNQLINQSTNQNRPLTGTKNTKDNYISLKISLDPFSAFFEQA